MPTKNEVLRALANRSLPSLSRLVGGEQSAPPTPLFDTDSPAPSPRSQDNVSTRNAPTSAKNNVSSEEGFQVILREHGPKKIQVIKALRRITNLGLKEAKQLSETRNAVIITTSSRTAAIAFQEELVSIRAVVDVLDPGLEAAIQSASESEIESARYTLYIRDHGPRKISVIRCVRKLANLGLRKARDLVASQSRPVHVDLSPARAKEMRELLEAEGAVVELVKHPVTR